jgi:hypothetical protein
VDSRALAAIPVPVVPASASALEPVAEVVGSAVEWMAQPAVSAGE